MLLVRRERPLRFVVAEAFRSTGSSIMRGNQLAALARSELRNRRVDVIDDRAVLGSTGADLFLTKGALKVLGREPIERLRRTNRLFFDVVDERPPVQTSDLADVLIAASVEASIELARAFPAVRVALVNHHVDPRVRERVRRLPQDRVHWGYFGETQNVLLPAALADRVEVIHVDTSTQRDASWLAKLHAANAHYAVRQQGAADLHKPFLKGFVAAHLGAPILIQRSQTEAGHWLGLDYPYWVDDTTPEGIATAMDVVESSFGGAEWTHALDRMAEVAARTQPDRIAKELAAALV